VFCELQKRRFVRRIANSKETFFSTNNFFETVIVFILTSNQNFKSNSKLKIKLYLMHEYIKIKLVNKKKYATV